MNARTHKKLIEVALPLKAINVASAREKSIRHGHPSTLHLWWARRPLAAARAVIFAQMVDDPSSCPDLFPTEEEQEKERQRLFRIIEDLVQWENTTNEEVLQRARDEIWKSWRRTCAENADHPRVKELFDSERLPAFHDPFAGGGALPLEAQRLGLEAYASDLNPVAVLINKAMIEIPPKFAGRPPVNPEARSEWREERSETGDALPGNDYLAKGDGDRTRGLSPGTYAPSRGNLRDALADHPRSDVDSGEHRRGLDEGIGPGESPVSGDRARVAGGDGDAPDAMRAVDLVSGGEDRPVEIAARRGKPDADSHAAQSPRDVTSHSSLLFPRSYRGAQGLAEDVRYYGKWMRDEAEKRIGHLYPKVEVTAEMAAERPDLKPYVGRELTVIAWLWARTVKSPNPAFASVDVPLAATFMLSTKPGKEAYVEPVLEDGGYRFTVKVGKPKDAEAAKNGTSAGKRAAFKCVMSGVPITYDYIQSEGRAGRMGVRLMVIVAEGKQGRVYLQPTEEMESVAREAKPEWKPDCEMPKKHRNFQPPAYGINNMGDIFTPRQLAALTTFSDLVQAAREQARRDAVAAGLPEDGKPLCHSGNGATAHAEAVSTYLAFAVSKAVDRNTSLCVWEPQMDRLRGTFGRQALPMIWDYAETNPFAGAAGDFYGTTHSVCEVLDKLPCRDYGCPSASQSDAARQVISVDKVVCTDPPYYDNVAYADLSDFFYVWLRTSMRPLFPGLFATVATPKADELVAIPNGHRGKEEAEKFFLDGMTLAMHRLAEQAHPAFPVTIYYAFKQSETDAADGTASTGWDTFLDAVIRAGFTITGTWPMRSELATRNIGRGANALASSIVLVCRSRAANAPPATRREFVAALKSELPAALAHLQRGNIAPVDLAQAAIGPGMAVYTRFSRVLDAEGEPLSVREALALINQILDEVLAEQEGDFDAETRWALAWFESYGFGTGEYGVAETLSKAKNTTVEGMVDAGILASRGGKVRLFGPSDLSPDWDPARSRHLTVWEIMHHLIKALERDGEGGAAELVVRVGSEAETARELAYRLYTVCERRKWTQEALSYNGLVISWPEIVRLAHEAAAGRPIQAQLL